MLKCPKCKSNRAVPIMLDYPAPEAFEAYERGEIMLGGCMIGPGQPDVEVSIVIIDGHWKPFRQQQ